MADETKTYRFVYDLNNKPFLSSLREMNAELLKTQGLIKTTGAMFKSLGQNTPGLRIYSAEIKKAVADLNSLVEATKTATTALKGVGRGNSAVASLSKDLSGLDNRALKTASIFKSMGTNTPGVTKMRGELMKLDAELKLKVTDANAAEKALKSVGTGNTAAASLTKKLNDLDGRLQAIANDAQAAQGGLSSLGDGVDIGAKGGSGKSSTSAATGKSGVAGIGRAMAAHLALSAGRKIAGAIGESISERRKFLGESADMVSGFREDLREVANLQGKPAVDDGLIRQQVQFQKETGLNADEARELRLEFGGAIAPGLARKNINQKTADDLEKEAGKFGLRYDLDMKTTGRMAGLLANYGPVPSAAAGVGTLAQSAEQLNIFGVGPVKGMMAPMLGLAGEMLESDEGGRFKDFPSMSARFAATTVSTAGRPSIAATQIRQSNRLLRKFNGQEEEAFLRAAGISPEDDYETAIRKIAPKIAGAQGDLTLAQAGFGNSTERSAVIKQAKMIPVVDQQLADPRMRAAYANAIPNNTAFADTQTGRQRSADNAEFSSEIENGLVGERLRTARANARARMADPNQPGGQRLKAGFFQSILDMSESVYNLGGVSGEELRIDSEAMKGLIRGGQQVGVDVRRLAPNASYNSDHGFPLDTAASRSEFNAAFEAVDKAGGDPFGGSPKRAAKALRNAADELDRMNPRGDKPQAGGAPVPPPAGNGGGGVNPGRR